MTTHQRRRLAQVRAVTGPEDPGATADAPRLITLHLITPGVVDDYGSLWMADCFDENLGQRLPAMVWAHDWSEPIGHGVDYRTSGDGPDVIFEFDNFDDVPRARQGYSQTRSGTITDCSVGFFYLQHRDPTDAEKEQYPGITEVIEKAGLDEVSLVLRGAVPGAKVLSIRSVGGTVEEELVVALGRKVAAGELTEEEAKAALRLAADDAAPPDATDQAVLDPEQAEQDRLELEADVQAALDAIEGHL
jgi:HK97 family phage prohead protease